MTETERKALALVNEVRAEWNLRPYDEFNREAICLHEALCRAIEQHEAFAQEVSDAVEQWSAGHGDDEQVYKNLTRFIIAKPDPLVEVLDECGVDRFESWADQLRAAIEKRGGKIVWGEG